MSDKLTPHQSFIGPNKITFSTEGHVSLSPNGELLQASSVYVPGSKETADRLRITTLASQIKAILDGTRKEEANPNIPPALREVLDSSYVLHPTTGERVLAVHESDAETWFSSSETLLAIMLDRVPAVPPEISQQVQKATGYLMSLGIPLKDLGLYGGLQSFVVHSGNHLLKDIDITVTGLEYVAAIKKIARTNQRYAVAGKQTRVKSVDPQIRDIRHQLTRIYLPNDSTGIFCDIRVIRRPSDRLSFTRDVLCTHKPTVIQGTVVDAVEVLSTPTSFVVQDEMGSKITISSDRYNYVGAVTEGMRVRVSGQTTTQPDHLLLIDQERDRIKYLQ